MIFRNIILIKLRNNSDKYPTKQNKLNYLISRLEN